VRAYFFWEEYYGRTINGPELIMTNLKTESRWCGEEPPKRRLRPRLAALQGPTAL
jgi:hypothetical protein